MVHFQYSTLLVHKTEKEVEPFPQLLRSCSTHKFKDGTLKMEMKTTGTHSPTSIPSEKVSPTNKIVQGSVQVLDR